MFDPCSQDRCRVRYVPKMRRDVRVPRHIVRLDGDSLAGWQVRFGPTSKYFSDGAHGGSAAALAQAKVHLRAVWRPMRKGKHGLIADAVSVICDNAGRWYARTYSPYHQKTRRFYIGTNSTFTAERQARAVARAKAFREEWGADKPVPLR